MGLEGVDPTNRFGDLPEIGEVSGRGEWEELVKDSISPTVFHTWSWKEFLEKQGYSLTYVVLRNARGKAIAGWPFYPKTYYRIVRMIEPLPRSDLSYALLTERADTGELAPKILGFLKAMPPWKRVIVAKIKLLDRHLCEKLVREGSEILAHSGSVLLDLEKKPPSHIWEAILSKKDRQKLRQFENEGFEFRLATERKEVDELHRLHGMNLIRLGSPVRPASFYTDLWEIMNPEFFQIANISLNDKVVCSGGFFTFRPTRTVHLSYIGYDHEQLRNRQIQLFLDWSTLKWAWENGFKYVNFGTAPYDPSHVYQKLKTRFGGEFVPIYAVRIPLHPRILKLLRPVYNHIKSSLRI